MPQRFSSRKITVCLLSRYPMVIGEFARLLKAGPHGVQPRTIPLSANPPAVPDVNVYVVDSKANRAATEMLITGIISQYPNARILVVGSAFTDQAAFPLLRLGVKGLLEHSQIPAQFECAVYSLATGGYWLPQKLLARFVDAVLKNTKGRPLAAEHAALSRRERQVIHALLQNLSNKEIAARLHISERTVEFHVSHLLDKFGVRRRADLIVHCYQAQTRENARTLKTA